MVDFDGDGHTDVLVTRIGLAPQLYRGAASGAFTLDTAMLQPKAGRPGVRLRCLVVV